MIGFWVWPLLVCAGDSDWWDLTPHAKTERIILLPVYK